MQIKTSPAPAQKYEASPLADWTTVLLPRHPIRGKPYEYNGHSPAPAHNPSPEYLRQSGAYEALDKLSSEELWTKAQSEGGEDARNFLIMKYTPLVERIALKLKKRLSRSQDSDDLISAGRDGLMDAIGNYDCSRNMEFESFAEKRIRGAIFDSLRYMDWVPRLVRHRVAKIEEIKNEFRLKTGLGPTDEEIASSLDVTLDKFYRCYAPLVRLGSLTPRTQSSEKSTRGPYLRVTDFDPAANGRAASPDAELQEQERKEIILGGLSGYERLLVQLYYYQGLTMKEIGLTLGLSESRVSQIHSSILGRLRAREGLESHLRDTVVE